MFTRRMTTWSSVSQFVLVNLQPFRRNSLMKCVPQPKIAPKSLQPTLGIQGRLRLSMLIPVKSLLAVFVTVRSKSISTIVFTPDEPTAVK